MNKSHKLLFIVYTLLARVPVEAQSGTEIKVRFDVKKTFQTIHNFSASDAWAAQFAGNWPDEKRNSIADWLFSTDTLSNGNPKGIGLSMWRFNMGAGSAEQGRESGIRDEWRRAPAFTKNHNKKLAGQIWFLEAAKQRGVSQFLGFFNSPPVHLTRNGKAFATGGKVNIDSSEYYAFAEYTVDVIKAIKQSRGVDFNYISPINEPQWDWSDGGQEGSPYTNIEISNLVKSFDRVFQKNNIAASLIVSESGSLKYLLNEEDKPGRGKQVEDFFNLGSANYIGNLPHVAKVIAAHSYFTTSPYSKAVSLRNSLRNKIATMPGLQYWQSEYCILGDNAGEINGSRKDTGMKSALYLAKVIHADLTEANATAWQWWTAISAYDYKDGLVYIDKKQDDGNVSDSKLLWALGNFSRFVRPGMIRIAVDMPAVQDLFVSAYFDTDTKEVVAVMINTGNETQTILPGTGSKKYKPKYSYTTSNTQKLERLQLVTETVTILPKSIVTIIMKTGKK